MLVDSHCHLNYPDFANDFEEMIGRARAAGIATLQTISTSLKEMPALLQLADRYPFIYSSVGVHPNHTDEDGDISIEDITRYSYHPKVVGIGETGLDYCRQPSDKDKQISFFKTHIQAAQETGLPLIVHTREAEEDTIAILTTEMKRKPFKGLIHCFTSSLHLAEAVMEIGFYISISGIITFKNALGLQEAVKHIPLDRLLVETDAPYLAPIPHRGKRNEPSYVAHTNKAVATLKGIDEAECAKRTSQNFYKLFNKVPYPAELAACA